MSRLTVLYGYIHGTDGHRAAPALEASLCHPQASNDESCRECMTEDARRCKPQTVPGASERLVHMTQIQGHLSSLFGLHNLMVLGKGLAVHRRATNGR
jgi:hypothetical protein